MAGQKKETDKFFTTANGLLLFSYQIDFCVFFRRQFSGFRFFSAFFIVVSQDEVDGDGNFAESFSLNTAVDVL